MQQGVYDLGIHLRANMGAVQPQGCWQTALETGLVHCSWGLAHPNHYQILRRSRDEKVTCSRCQRSSVGPSAPVRCDVPISDGTVTVDSILLQLHVDLGKRTHITRTGWLDSKERTHVTSRKAQLCVQSWRTATVSVSLGQSRKMPWWGAAHLQCSSLSGAQRRP